MPVEQVTDNRVLLLKAVKALSKCAVLVGIPADSAPREDNAPITNSQIGFKNEFGSPAENIPARPHLMPAIVGASEDIRHIMLAGARQVLRLQGDPKQQAKQAMNKVGLFVVPEIKKKITSGLSPALSEMTLRNRREAGRDGELPLIDTGSYINSFTYVIEND